MKWYLAAVVLIALLDVAPSGCFGGRSPRPRPPQPMPVEPIADPEADEAPVADSAEPAGRATPDEEPAAAGG